MRHHFSSGGASKFFADVWTTLACETSARIGVDVHVGVSGKAGIGHGVWLAEEKGFEPLVPLRVRRFSKPLPSTTRPLLQNLLAPFSVSFDVLFVAPLALLQVRAARAV